MKDLLGEFDISERDLRETLRKLDDAGLAQRVKGVWKAISVETADAGPRSSPDQARAAIRARTPRARRTARAR